jgi:hypothetical protein
MDHKGKSKRKSAQAANALGKDFKEAIKLEILFCCFTK